MLKIPLKVRVLIMRTGLFVLSSVIVAVIFILGKMLIERFIGIEITMDTTVITVAAVVGVDYVIWKRVSRRMKKELVESSENNKI